MKTLLMAGALLAPLSVHAATIGTWNPTVAPQDEGWTLDTSGGGGGFLANPANNGDNNTPSPLLDPSWGLWTEGAITATWNLAGGALEVGQSVTVGLDNGWINGGRTVSLSFADGGTSGLSWSFLGDGGSGYRVTDAGGTVDSGKGWTDAGMFLTFTLTSATNYRLDVVSPAFGEDYSTTGTLSNGLNSISQLVVSSDMGEGGFQRDVYMGGIAVVPEPSFALLGSLGLLGLLRRRR